MSAGVYIGSTTPRAGKSLLAFSLGLLFRKAGFSVGYMKPVGCIPGKKDDVTGDADAMMVQEVLGQEASPDVLTPVMLPEDIYSPALHEKHENALGRIRDAYRILAAGKEICLVSGVGAFPCTGYSAGADGLSVVRELDLKVLLAVRFHRRINLDGILTIRDSLGDSLIGVVLNDVQENDRRAAAEILLPWLRGRGVPVTGCIGREPALAAVRMIDLAHNLNGRIVAGNEQATGMVSDFLIGSMQVDNFMLHLHKRADCAVITGGDRQDLQIAAICAGCPCIILTGNVSPVEMIRAKAEEKNVVLIRVREDAYCTARNMARIFRAKKIRDLKQLRAGTRLVENSLDIRLILGSIGTQYGEPAPAP
ncbi:MAG: AAA family ATPase [Desulfovibrio sp.]|jgi:BioD-like phosphotransacetylase family protein|nr:AAA family ATPase [Desulfovibrio sp.]